MGRPRQLWEVFLLFYSDEPSLIPLFPSIPKNSPGLPRWIPSLPCAALGIIPNEADIHTLAALCAYEKTRTMGSFQVLDYEDIYSICTLTRQHNCHSKKRNSGQEAEVPFFIPCP